MCTSWFRVLGLGEIQLVFQPDLARLCFGFRVFVLILSNLAGSPERAQVMTLFVFHYTKIIRVGVRDFDILGRLWLYYSGNSP